MENQILDSLFRDIAEGNVVLFLGAGSSVTDSKIYLSKQLLDYYRDLKNIDYEPSENDIVDFVNKVFSLPEYDRNDFDLNVARWLKKNVKAEGFHKFAIGLPWLSIITTNIDLVLENAIEEENYEEKYEILRNYTEFQKALNNGDKCKIIKLHGCISDLGRYPLLFSSADFERNNKFYNKLFSQIKGWSDKIKILFVGYSFNDRFGSLFLNLFMKEMGNRQFYMLSPNLDESRFNMKYLAAKNITPIKSKFSDLLSTYEKWVEENAFKTNDTKNNIFKETSGKSIPFSVQSKISPFLLPLNDSYDTYSVNEKEFYLGSEPNFSVIKKNYDIIKEQKIKEISQTLNAIFDEKGTSVPFVFLTGSYGSGKSTFSYRLLKQMIDSSSDLLVFEIKDFEKISFPETINFINKLKDTRKIIFYSDQTEQDLNFKKLRELRSILSSNQFENISIIILQSIRENILEGFKRKYNPELSELRIDCAFSDAELEFFLEKLNKNELIKFRSAKEKKQIIEDLKAEQLIYDQLSLSLYLLKRGDHYKYIIDTYKSFQNPNTQKAFLFTSLLYQYGIKMPLSLLNSIIDTDWDTFIKDVFKSDGKGIFIQETVKPDFYLKSDIYFKIKHKIVAENFIKNFIKPKELFKNYQYLVTSMPQNEESIYVFVNLIKSIQLNKILDDEKINKLYDNAYKKLNLFPRFSIYYSRNLQNRGTNRDLIRALNILEEAEEINIPIYNQRDKLIIHRKAVVNFNLARKYYNEFKIELAKEHVIEAIELFDIKHSIDPTSNFSYIDFIKMLIWYIGNFNLDAVEKTKIENKLRFIINKGMLNMNEGINQLLTFKNGLENRIDKIELRERADLLYENTETRPLALLILIELEEEEEKISEIISEMEQLLYDDDIQNYLFNYYGENLQYLDQRVKFFDLIRKNRNIQEHEGLNWLYYNFVAESYNLKFQTAFEYQRRIRNDYKNAFIREPFEWKDTGSQEVKIFKGKVFKNSNGFNEIKILNMGSKLVAKLNNKEYSDLKDQETYNVSLYFTYTGIWAKIIDKIDE